MVSSGSKKRIKVSVGKRAQGGRGYGVEGPKLQRFEGGGKTGRWRN